MDGSGAKMNESSGKANAIDDSLGTSNGQALKFPVDHPKSKRQLKREKKLERMLATKLEWKNAKKERRKLKKLLGKNSENQATQQQKSQITNAEKEGFIIIDCGFDHQMLEKVLRIYYFTRNLTLSVVR